MAGSRGKELHQTTTVWTGCPSVSIATFQMMFASPMSIRLPREVFKWSGHCRGTTQVLKWTWARIKANGIVSILAVIRQTRGHSISIVMKIGNGSPVKFETWQEWKL